MTDQERTELRAAYLDRKPASTKEEWRAQVERFQGKLNIESLLMEGNMKGWNK